MSKKDLETFFANLEDRCITVCQGCTERQVLTRKKPSDIGYCFYRPHEGIYANETGTLYLSWGSYSTDEMDLLIVVDAIKDEAKICNIDISWAGSMHDRLILNNLDKTFFRNVVV